MNNVLAYYSEATNATARRAMIAEVCFDASTCLVTRRMFGIKGWLFNIKIWSGHSKSVVVLLTLEQS